MATTLTPQAKHSVTQTTTARNTVTGTNVKKPGAPWVYNQSAYTYNQVSDPSLLTRISYNSSGGTATVMTNQTRN